MSSAKRHRWLLFLSQVPGASSTARVTLWRHLRASGAISPTQGAWVLPAGERQRRAFGEIARVAREQGGSAAVFDAAAIEGVSDDELIERFRAERGREYTEFHTKADDFLAEIAKETRAGKFMFAELEEIEDDLLKLTAWLAKIRDRDFFPHDDLTKAEDHLRRCELEHQRFAAQVYEHEKLNDPNS
ncbi:MAG: Chromate resistance protein ChrB [Pseudomonadota bacterium]